MNGLVYIFGGRVYDFLDEYFEKTRYEKIRKNMLLNLSGKVLEAGCGTGRNFIYYPNNTFITAFDNSARMLSVARQRVSSSKAVIKLRKMNIININFPDDTFDNIVATFVLCVIPKKIEQRALNELIRVAKPNARLYFLEYVYSENKLRAFVMRITSFIPKLLFSIRFNTTYQLIKRNKLLSIEKTEFVYDDVIRLIVAKKLKA